MNAEIVKQKKIGTILNYKELDEEALESVIKHILEDNTFQLNVEGMSSLVQDSRTHPLEVSTESKMICKKIYNFYPKALPSYFLNSKL